MATPTVIGTSQAALNTVDESSWTYTGLTVPSTGQNRALFVAVYAAGSGASNSATWNGVSMSLVVDFA